MREKSISELIKEEYRLAEERHKALLEYGILKCSFCAGKFEEGKVNLILVEYSENRIIQACEDCLVKFGINRLL